jgi:hypothetical protein
MIKGSIIHTLSFNEESSLDDSTYAKEPGAWQIVSTIIE